MVAHFDFQIKIGLGVFITEVGRQPWIIYKVMRTADAVSPMKGVVYRVWLDTTIYLVLAIFVTWLFPRRARVSLTWTFKGNRKQEHDK